MFPQAHVIMPSLDVIDRICGEALTRGTRHVYIALTSELGARHLLALDGLLVARPGTKTSVLTWLRQRVQVGLNKGEAKNALARAVFLNKLGEIRDRSFEIQRYRDSGLNLVAAAIVLWNTVYLESAVQALCAASAEVDDKLLSNLSPLGWEHINLTGDYIWRQSKRVEKGKLWSLRASRDP